MVNAAVHGYSTYQQIIMLNKLNQSISPDFVLSSFSAANDVIENATIRERIASNSNSSGGGVARNSHVARLLQRTFADAIYFASNRWPPNVNFTIGLMTLFEQRIGAIGVPLEMIMIPARHQVRASVHAGSGAMRWLRLEWLLTYHNSRVKDHFTRAGVSFTDALPALFEHDKVEPVLFVDDMHPNELGHQIMAQIVFDKIKHRIGELVARNCPARSVSNAGGELR